MKSFAREFRAFVMRGNVVDLAVGVVIGTAFNAVVTALVTDIMTPPIGLLIGKVNFAELALNLGGTVTIKYGLFIQAFVAFLITAFALFLVIKLMSALNKKEKEDPTPASKSAELVVLEEIRDSLKNHSPSASI
ncbi:MAG TPA: large-conductance mechanosensitive channel protein MscL [Candidatus Paceibacterota bacterium]|nr:large-conductance mechanosensitive channel protein MscL [Candidatus Paceibacterota bacterium]